MRVKVYNNIYLYSIISSFYCAEDYINDLNFKQQNAAYPHPARMTASLQRLREMEHQENITMQSPERQETKENLGKCCYLYGSDMVWGGEHMM